MKNDQLRQILLYDVIVNIQRRKKDENEQKEFDALYGFTLIGNQYAVDFYRLQQHVPRFLQRLIQKVQRQLGAGAFFNAAE